MRASHEGQIKGESPAEQGVQGSKLHDKRGRPA